MTAGSPANLQAIASFELSSTDDGSIRPVAGNPRMNTHNTGPPAILTWNHDSVLRQHLRQLPEPSPVNTLSRGIILVRLRLLRSRLRDLEIARLDIAYRGSHQLDDELAAVLYKRKIHLWMAFPINDLPPEILSAIFRLAVGNAVDPSEVTLIRLHLTWVCRYWRNVAIGDQGLWSTIWFRDFRPWNRSLAFLERAGTSILEIRIDEKENRNPNAPGQRMITREDVEGPLDAVFRKLPQIQALAVVVYDRLAAYAVLDRLRMHGPAVQLSRLHIHSLGEPKGWVTDISTGEPPSQELMALCGGFTPQLRHLTLFGMVVDWNKLSVRNLKVLDLRRIPADLRMSLDLFRETLRQSPNLIKLALDSAGPIMTDSLMETVSDGELPPINLPNLRDLFLCEMSMPYCGYILMNFTARDLRNLVIANIQEVDNGPLIELLIGRFPNLQMMTVIGLYIEDGDLNRDHLFHWFESMPKLTLLKVGQVSPIVYGALLEDPRLYLDDYSDDSMDDDDEPHPAICSELKYFHFFSQDPQSVAKLVMERASLNVPFEKVFVVEAFLNSLPKDLAKDLREAAHGTLHPLRAHVSPEENRIFMDIYTSPQTEIAVDEDMAA